jgi:hypothetical protein
VGKPEVKRSLRRPRCKCTDSIKMDLIEIGWDGMDWSEHGNESLGSIKCWEVPEWLHN